MFKPPQPTFFQLCLQFTIFNGLTVSGQFLLLLILSLFRSTHEQQIGLFKYFSYKSSHLLSIQRFFLMRYQSFCKVYSSFFSYYSLKGVNFLQCCRGGRLAQGSNGWRGLVDQRIELNFVCSLGGSSILISSRLPIFPSICRTVIALFGRILIAFFPYIDPDDDIFFTLSQWSPCFSNGDRFLQNSNCDSTRMLSSSFLLKKVWFSKIF